MPTSGEVQVEEVAVEDGLHNSGDDGNLIEEALSVITPHPVGQVKNAIQT